MVCRCEDCISGLFYNAKSSVCPLCRKVVLQKDFSSKDLDRQHVDSELDVRLRILKRCATVRTALL